jgi:hypothetical protein
MNVPVESLPRSARTFLRIPRVFAKDASLEVAAGVTTCLNPCQETDVILSPRSTASFCAVYWDPFIALYGAGLLSGPRHQLTHIRHPRAALAEVASYP